MTRARRAGQWLLGVTAALLVFGSWPNQWEPELRRELERTDRVRLRTGGVCHQGLEPHETLYEERDPQAIRELIEHLQVSEMRSWSSCRCCEGPTLEFYQGSRLLVSLAVQHGHSLRWAGRWPTDGELTLSSRRYLRSWVKKNSASVK